MMNILYLEADKVKHVCDLLLTLRVIYFRD